MAYRYYNIRIVGLSSTTCRNVLHSASLHVVRQLGSCFYRIRTSRLYESQVRELIENCAREEGYPTTIVEVDSKRPGASKEMPEYAMTAF